MNSSTTTSPSRDHQAPPGSSDAAPSREPHPKLTLSERVQDILKQAWDSDYVPEGRPLPSTDRFDFARVLPYLFLHAGCLLVFAVGWSWFAVVAALVLYFIRMFGITAFYHRYFSHRSFRTSRTGQLVFAIFANTSMQRGALWWAATHRHHHKHSDEEEDKHSPRQKGFIWSHIGWLTSPRNFPTDYKKVKDLAKFPELVFLNKHDSIVPILFGAGLYLLGSVVNLYFPGLGTSGAQLFVWGFFVSTVLLLHGTFSINSLSHIIGRRRFKTEDDSRNNGLLALATLGEGWHNNHHRFQHSARQGFYWYEIDITFYILKLMEWTHVIWDLKKVPDHVYEEARQNAANSAG